MLPSTDLDVARSHRRATSSSRPNRAVEGPAMHRRTPDRLARHPRQVPARATTRREATPLIERAVLGLVQGRLGFTGGRARRDAEASSRAVLRAAACRSLQAACCRAVGGATVAESLRSSPETRGVLPQPRHSLAQRGTHLRCGAVTAPRLLAARCRHPTRLEPSPAARG
jgi:hypothetical protein